MKTETFTPGPWKIAGQKITALNGASHICDVTHHAYGYADQRALANAALIAASPEMFELAKSIAAQDHFFAGPDSTIAAKQIAKLVNDWIDAARAAIAKVEGSAS